MGVRAADTLPDHLAGSGHLPDRPSWDCGACSQPWPCDPARVRLAEAYGCDRVGLAMYLGALLVEAYIDQPDASAEEMYGRFVAWTR